MEATVALGLAGNVTQFLDFGIKLCRTINQIYNSSSGASNHNAATETLVTAFLSSLDAVSRDLAKYCAYLGDDAAAQGAVLVHNEILAVMDGCRDLALDMLGRLEKLKADKNSKMWKSFLQAIEALWREQEILEVEQKLHKFRTELQWIIVVSLRKSLDLLESRQEDQFQRLQSSISGILWELIQANRKTLPQWTVKLPTSHDDHHQPSGSSSEPTHRTVPPRPNDAESLEQKNTDIQLAESLAGAFRRAEKSVLDSLHFMVMQDREREIAAAETATFEWIFSDPKVTDKPWSNFYEWLTSDGNGRLYWINGKAGSGKSTLMKYLVRHRRTKEGLQAWAGKTKLLLSSFFFWYSGCDLQKSQTGLLRALLYSCLKNHRELMPIVVPDTASLREEDLRNYWTLSRLCDALERLVSQTLFDIKYAFFIDGLDEYAGTFDDIIDILATLAMHGNVKVCASSRPLLAFERAFQSSPHLILQHLTYDDIRLYVSNKLGDNDRIKDLDILDPGLQANLATSIVTKAAGVFLWVYLVVRSLLDGLRNFDVGVDLKRRLDDLPDELESLYWHMVDRVQPAWYLEEGFRLLRMVKASSGGVSLLRLCLAEAPEEVVHKLGLHSEPCLRRQEALCRDMAGRLKSRCLGLLEVASDDAKPTKQVVTFIHKSVFDFLETDAVQSRLKACPGQDKFCAEVALLRASVLELKTLPGRGQSQFSRVDWFTWLRPAICECIILALAAEAASGTPNVELLRQLQSTADSLWGSVNPKTSAEEDGKIHWISAHTPSFEKGNWGSEPASHAEFDESFQFLDGPPLHGRPGSIKSFDELCQRAGLSLFATAVGMQLETIGSPQKRLQYNYHQANGSQSLAAAQEISTIALKTQPLILQPSSPVPGMHDRGSSGSIFRNLERSGRHLDDPSSRAFGPDDYLLAVSVPSLRGIILDRTRPARVSIRPPTRQSIRPPTRHVSEVLTEPLERGLLQLTDQAMHGCGEVWRESRRWLQRRRIEKKRTKL